MRRPFPALDENPLLDLMNYHTPTFYGWVLLWYYVSPFAAVMLAGLFVMPIWKVWFESPGRDFATFGGLPTWPLSPDQKAPEIVIGEVHHPVQTREIFNPSWLTIPERGLYTGVAIFGAVGSGKTNACMNPFARQLLGWQAANPQKRAAALVLEVKGNFCHDIRQILVEAGSTPSSPTAICPGCCSPGSAPRRCAPKPANWSWELHSQSSCASWA